MSEIRETRFIREALHLARIVCAAQASRIGEIIGPAGCGKTTAGHSIAATLGGVRVCAWDGVTRHQLARVVAHACDITGRGAVDRLLAGEVRGRLLVVDEANKLSWHPLELLRYLSDECGFSVILIGTDLFERQFSAARTRDMLLQLGSRIGAKRVRGGHLDRAETYAHCIKPRLGECADRELVGAFWVATRRGNFREAVELAEECRRVMEANGFAQLTPAVVEAATKWMANRHAVAGSGE